MFNDTPVSIVYSSETYKYLLRDEIYSIVALPAIGQLYIWKTQIKIFDKNIMGIYLVNKWLLYVYPLAIWMTSQILVFCEDVSEVNIITGWWLYILQLIL